MPARWVVRRDPNGHEVAAPVRCFVAGAIVAEPGVRTVEQCIADLITGDEEVVGGSEKQLILRAGVFVGYIEITRETP
jgi:hypothetical protein